MSEKPTFGCVKCQRPLVLERVIEVLPRPDLNKIEMTHTCECTPGSEPVTVRYSYNVSALRGLFGKVPALPWKSPFSFNDYVDEEYATELRTFRFDLEQLGSADEFLWWCEAQA